MAAACSEKSLLFLYRAVWPDVLVLKYLMLQRENKVLWDGNLKSRASLHLPQGRTALSPVQVGQDTLLLEVSVKNAHMLCLGISAFQS